MKKTTLLGTGIVLLLVINAITLGYIYMKAGSHPPPRREPKEIIAGMLHFDAAQRHTYEKQIAWHRGRINRLDNQIRNAKMDLYALLNENNDVKKDSLINVIAGLQKEIEQTHYKHFADIRSICTPEQQVYYSQLITELPQLFGPPMPPGPQHH